MGKIAPALLEGIKQEGSSGRRLTTKNMSLSSYISYIAGGIVLYVHVQPDFW